MAFFPFVLACLGDAIAVNFVVLHDFGKTYCLMFVFNLREG